MNKKQKKSIIIISVLMAIFSILLILGIFMQYKETGGLITIKKGPITYILLGIFILLLVSIIALNIILKQDLVNRKYAKELHLEISDSSISDGADELFFYKQKIIEVDRKIVLEKYNENVEYLIDDSYYDQIKDDIEEDENAYKNIKGDEDSRFYMLSQIDNYMEIYQKPKYNDDVTLKEICENFRNYSARYLKLYYDIEDIRRFIGGLSVTRLMILQGMSGTGKTSLAYAFGEFLNNKTVVVPIQPMWKERTDLVGYYNEFTKKFNETTLLYKMYEANYNDEIYITVLDEMNIARIEYYFAEFLSLLELPNPEGRNLDVVSDKWDNDPKLLKNGQLRLPINMWFVGTANNDDSTFAISDKVYDRAMVLNLDKKAKPFDAPKIKKMKISSSHLQKLFEDAQKEYEISDRNLRRIKKLDEFMIANFHLTFGNRIMKQINSYVPVLVACGGTEIEAIDDILARKVFRKLESKNPVYVRQMSDTVCNYLDELFGIDKMPLCKEVIKLIEQNL